MALVLIFALSVTASAAVSAPKVSCFATVMSDGSCQVTMTVTLHITEQTKDLTFPVPAQATGITLNGSRVGSTRSETARYVNLGRALGKALGDVSFTLHYTIHNIINTTEQGTLELRLPMLSGFESPIESMDFSVTLPGQVTALPGFESGYHQKSIEQYLSYKVDGAVITGNALEAMKDHETLSMVLTVDETMFPQTMTVSRDWSIGAIAMGVCAALALLYWLIFWMFVPLRQERCSDPPEGFTAGETGCVLHLQGVDLSQTVLSWARLGYVTVQPDRRGRVLIHKRMEMGNERKDAERRLFATLFGKKNTVDTGSAFYANLVLSMAKKPMGLQEQLHRRSGNPKVFRGLAAGIGLFGGVCMAIAMSGGALLQGLLILVLGVLGGISGWYIQLWCSSMILGRSTRLAGCLTVASIWLLLALAAGVFPVGLWMVLGLLLAGVLLAWGGRRTFQGKQAVAQMLGLRRHLRSVDKETLQRLCENDPYYFFSMAPCAMALGQGKVFARRFGKLRLESCPYLVVNTEAKKTAVEWLQLLQRTEASMNARARQLPWEQLLGLLRSFRK